MDIPDSLSGWLKCLLAITLLVHSSRLAFANEPLKTGTISIQTIQEIIQRDNPALRAARARWESMKLRIPQTRAWEDPIAGVDFQRAGTTRMANVGATEWMVSQQLPLSGKNLSRGRIAEAEAKASNQEFLRVQWDLFSKARLAYFKLANVQAQLELNERNRLLLAQIVEITRTKYEAGLKSRSDLLLAQTDLARLDESKANLQRDQLQQQSTLNWLMNRPPNRPLGTPESLTFHPFSVPEEKLVAIAQANRPEIARANYQTESARAQLQLARRQWIPDPQLQIEARQLRGSSKAIEEYNTGIAFSIPWVNFKKYKAATAEAQKTLDAALAEQNGTDLEMRSTIRTQLEEIQAAAHNYLLFKENLLPLAAQAFESARIGYETDKAGFLDLITAWRTIQETESAMLDHLASHSIAIAELEGLIGSFEPQ